MIYDFKTREMLAIVVVVDIDITRTPKNIVSQRLKYQRKAVDVTIFVNAKVKIYYNVKHQAIFFCFDEKVYLQLHYNYKLFD